MSVLAQPGLWAGLLTASAATPFLARLAGRLGWLDRSEGPAAARKLQGRPVPPVGGAAVLLGLTASWLAIRALGGHWDPGVAAWIHPVAGAAALLLAFAAGAIDDARRGGLAPGAKLAFQGLAALPVALSVLFSVGGDPAVALGAAGAVFVGAVLAQNAFNTFDNADGCTASLGICALAFSAPVLAGALVGFLPYNLNARRADGARGVPTAYLGDSGSHMLGMLLLLVPAAWPAFALPLFDLARLAVRRVQAGSRPWIGDRRHLAHRLEHAGLGRASVAALLVLVALPAIALAGPGGLFLTALLFAVAVGLTCEPSGTSGSPLRL